MNSITGAEPATPAEIAFFRIARALTEEPWACRLCGSPMKPGQALAQTFVGSPDFPGDTSRDDCTVSAGGPGVLIDCSKCSACGWSVTA